MVYSISFIVTEKYDPTRNEIGLKVILNGFSKYNNSKIRFAAFPPLDKTLSKTGSITFESIGNPGNNNLEIIEPKTNRMIQQIGSINGNIFTEGGKGQEIKITHKTKTAEIEFIKVPKLKNEVIRLDASPKIPLFFGLEIDSKQPIYTKKVDSKGSFKEEITGVITEKHEIRVFTSQMNKICSIKPPE